MFNKSFHFIPLSNEKFIAKSSEINSDCIILDLEDGVSKKQKDLARNNLKEYFSDQNQNKYYLRINTECQEQFEKDLMLVNETKWNNIMLPKVSLKNIDILERKINHNFNLFPLFESIKSIYHFEEIILATKKISYIGLGLEDILAEYAYEQNDLEELIRNINNSIIIKSKAFDITCIDGVSLDFNEESFKKICRISKSYGFDGKMSIHPSQIEVINQTWKIDKNKYLHAKEIIDFTGNDLQTGYVKYKDEIITPPKIKKFQTIIKSYEKKI